MKKYYFFLLILTLCTVSKAQIINFPDSNFKVKLLTGATALNGSGNPITIDMNGDNEIDLNEALRVYTLKVISGNISDLSGIEYFTNLIDLNCSNNSITSLNLLSLIHLNTLWCTNNNFTTLNFSMLTELIELNCAANQLTSLNLEGLVNLRVLRCGGNQLTSLDLSQHPILNVLHCDSNQLTDLDVSPAIYLRIFYCTSNRITNLDLTNLTYLRDFMCYNNLLRRLDVSNMIAYSRVNASNNPLISLNFKTGITLSSSNMNADNMAFSGCPNLRNICAEQANVAQIQAKALGYGYTNCLVSSDCSLTDPRFNKASFAVIPNPVEGLLNIEFTDFGTDSSITIYDTLGRSVMQTSELDQTKTVDVSSLKSGNYFLKINSDKGSSSAKFVKL